MKRKRIASKLLSLMLSAAVIVSSSFSGVSLVDVSATQVPAEETVSDNSAEDVTDVTDALETEVDETQETEIEETQEAVAEETQETETPQHNPETELMTPSDDVEEKAESAGFEIGTTDDVKPEKKETNENLLMKSLVDDTVLQQALVKIYEETVGKDTSVNTMTMKQMKELGVIDLSIQAYSSITNISGLTYAENATEINLAGTKVKMIPANEFQNFKKLTTIVLPDELEGMGDFAFQNCTALTEINVSENGGAEVKNTLPSSLRDDSTGSSIFNGCTNLTEINIPNFDEGMEAALQKAASIFANCKGLTTVNIAANVANIPLSAFEGAGATTGMTVTIASGSELKKLLGSAFKNANLAAIDFSNCAQLEEIGDECFSATGNQTKKLSEIKLPASVSSLKIGKDAFFKAPLAAMYVGNAKEEGFVCIPDYVTSIGSGAFMGNTAMKKLQLSKDLPEINEHTFDGCTALASVQFSANMSDCKIKRIGNAAFKNTSSLTSAAFIGKMNRLVKIGDEKLTIAVSGIHELPYPSARVTGRPYGSDVFKGSKIVDLVLPSSLRVINSRSFFGVSTLQSVEWKTGTLTSGQVFEINSEAFSGCSALNSFKYTNTTQKGATLTIDQYAFAGCKQLVIFSENGVSNANGMANALPQSLIKVGKRAFAECDSLPAMSIKDTESGSAPVIAEEVFYKALALEKAELPTKLTEIPKGMYYDAALTTLPTFAGGVCNVSKIGDLAFMGNCITTADMRKWTKLAAIGRGAFAYVDTFTAGMYSSDDLLFAPLEKIVLPSALSGTDSMVWGAAMLQGATNFTTLATPSWSKEDVVYIPNYVKEQNCGANVFNAAGVQKAHWGFTDVSSGANVWSGIPDGMFYGTKVSNLADCCLPETALVKIGKSSYASCYNLTEVDLSTYPYLTSTGDGAFANCMNVTRVALPNNGLYKKVSTNLFRVGFFGTMATSPKYYYSSIESVDFGGVEELGDFCFATFNDKAHAGDNSTTIPAGYTWPSSMTKLDLKGSSVKTIGTGAFKGNYGLVTIDFGMTDTIGTSAFEQCANLNLTNAPMSDSVRIIGVKAFYRCPSLGKVTFGSGVAQINASAFELCAAVNDVSRPTTMTKSTGLTAVDFSKAKNLVLIGQRAFYLTALEQLDLTSTNVQTMDGAVFASNPYLEQVRLGETMQWVGPDVFCGCVRLNYFSFYSTTTMSKSVFNSRGSFSVVDNDKARYTTPISSLSFEVKPVELNVGLGRAMKFPYYVNEYVNGQVVKFDEMYIGNASNTDKSIYKYIKVSASTAGYYLNEVVPGQAITDPKYFEQITDSSKMITKVGSKSVTTFEIQGLQATPAGKSIPFTVMNNFVFNSADAAEGVSMKLTTTFDMKVMDIPYYPVIYTDRARTLKEETLVVDEATGLTKGTTELRAEAKNPTGTKTVYYDIKMMQKTNWQPDSGNLIVHSSDPSVVVCSNGIKVAGKDDTWLLKAEYTAAVTRVSDITSGRAISIRPLKHGDAVITIYPENCPSKKITWNIQSRADLKAYAYVQPPEFTSGQYVGAQFQCVQTLVNYLGQSVTYADGTLYDYKKITDNTLYCKSMNPDILTIDNYGKVTIHKVPSEPVTVGIAVWAVTPAGEKIIEQNKMMVVKYSQLRNNSPAYSDNGETVKVTKLAAGKSLPEVTYVAPKAGATSVTIPNTMYVYGVKCKVTAIDPEAFKGNKKIKSVTIGKYVTTIPEGAFKGCKSLTSVTFKGNVKEIGNSAFEKCTALKKITIPKTVKTIGNKAFNGCTKLATVTFKTKSKLVEIGNSAFQGCKALKKITIPSTYLTTIGKSAFNKCANLKKIVVKSKKVKTVGKNAFKGIHSKATIDVPNNMRSKYKTLFKKGQGKKVKIK